ncbi:hypothetical protein Q2T76_06215 [Lactobacillus sp. YT155]|uniref:hypothetical protein n=1 Tax=Lactobacillus sp. YT155 TaxID=3060955 RepID=UPI00266053CB|nr:hypothetical protein [Lactobacillus sp. YT155]MDO1605655.1 hypothetical protein [Lactobacillus sp. YT155]
MEDEVYEQVYQLIHDMYNDLVDKPVDQGIKDTLLKAATYLTTKKMPPQVVAVKTVNTITMKHMGSKTALGKENSERMQQLMILSRAGGYKWNPQGIGSLGVTFFD